jgi:IclR family acetate operon transcriptional repressor
VNHILGNKKISGAARRFPSHEDPPQRPRRDPMTPTSTWKGPVQPLERYVIPNLRNACRVLKLLRGHPGGLKAADLARMLGIPVTTTMRITATLQIEGLVQKTDGRYGLGPVLIHLGNAALAGTDIRKLALPLLQKLTLLTNETSHLAIPCNERSLIIAVQDSPHPLRAVSPAGFLTDLHSSSTGKVFLSYVFQGQLAQLHATEPPYRHTAHTLTRRADLEREVELTRRRGYSIDDEECHSGVRCVAAPIFSSDGSVVAAIGITAASVRLAEKRIPEVAAKVRAVAAEASQLLGFSPPSEAPRSR